MSLEDLAAREAAGFRPEWSSLPSETAADAMAEKRIAGADLQARLGLNDPQWRDLMSGAAAITASIAERLADVLGGTPKFWLTREAQYRAAEARLYGEVKR